MENYGKPWTNDEENKMIVLLAQTQMSSVDCDTIFSAMFDRTPNAIYMRRLLIAKRLLKNGHQLSYICVLLHLTDADILNNT
jgi:AraC-like DNA-binding protein